MITQPCVHMPACDRRHLFFIASIRLKTLQLTLPRSGDLSFEFMYGKNIISSKGFHAVDGRSRIKAIGEAIEIPMSAVYDRRKNRFTAEHIQMTILHHHLSSNRRVGTVALSPGELLNSRQIRQLSNHRIDKCTDKAAMIDTTIQLKFMGIGAQSKIDESYFSVSDLR